jgi:large subunit ribosomal protein L6e
MVKAFEWYPADD